MSLTGALQRLPDDRATRQAVGHVLRHFVEHPRQPVSETAIASVTGVDAFTLRCVLESLVAAVVIDCDAEPRTYVYTPSIGLDVEVERYLRTNERTDSRLRGNVGRFRERHLHNT